MLHIALRGWYAVGGWSAEETRHDEPTLGVPGGSERRNRFLRNATRVLIRALTFCMFHEAFLDELAVLTLLLGTLQVRQREVGLFAGFPLIQTLSRRKPICDAEMARAITVANNGAAADAHLVRLGDKQILWSADGQSFLMYARQGGKLIALFDPVGPSGNWNELARAFRSLARRRNCIPVFYQVSEAFLSLSAMAGIRGYKLGELAEISLPAFTMNGGDWANLRRAINRATRDGLTYTFLSPEEVPAVLDELRAISDAWLAHGGTREKRFSLGAFDPAYVATSPVAVVRMDGHIVAFANVLTTEKGAAFVDLMRFLPGAHRGAMDFLIVKLIEDLKARGFQALNLGMAPLSGLSCGAGATLWERVGAFVARNGNRFYGFQGLYTFKAKFEPDWRPRYLAVPSGTSPYLSAAATATLIAGGLSGIFRR